MSSEETGQPAAENDIHAHRGDEATEQENEEAYRTLEESLYTRLRQALEPRIDALIEARAEYFLPIVLFATICNHE